MKKMMMLTLVVLTSFSVWSDAEDEKKQREMLERLARAAAEEAIRQQKEVALDGKEKGVLARQRQEETRKLDDQAALAEIARNDKDASVREKAVFELTDHALLSKIARNDRNPDGAVVMLLYYFNPTPNDRNIEYDPNENLFDKKNFRGMQP